MRKFYFLSCLSNFLILLLVGQFVFPLIEGIVSNHIKKFTEISCYVNYSYYFYFFVFWWLAPLSILLIKNYLKHLLLFITINVLLAVIILISSFKYGFEIILYDLLLFIVPSMVISISVYYSQMIIGKKLLPTKYKRNAE